MKHQTRGLGGKFVAAATAVEERQPQKEVKVKVKVVMAEAALLSDLKQGEKFVLEGTRYYVAVIGAEILCMSLIKVGNAWSGHEYHSFSPDTAVQKITV